MRRLVRAVARRGRTAARARMKWARVLALAVALAACGPDGGASSCDPVPLGSTVVDAERVILGVGFDPVWPCSTRGGFTVSSLRVDSLGAGATNRLVIVVTIGGAQAYTLTASPGRVPFTAIPQGSEVIAIDGTAGARGFRGRSAAGTDIAFLQWQHLGLTYEVTATLGPRLNLDSVRSLVRGMTDGRAVHASIVVQ